MAARAAVEPWHNSPEIATELQNAPQVADPHYTRLMRLLALSHQNLSADDLIHLFSKIENKDLQKKAYTKILESANLSPEEKLKFQDTIQDPAIISEQEQAVDRAHNASLPIEERYAAARSIQDLKKQEKAFCAIVGSVWYFDDSDLANLKEALQGLPQSVRDAVFFAAAKRPCLFSKVAGKAAKLIQDAKKRKDALYCVKIVNALNDNKALIETATSLENLDKQQEALHRAAMNEIQKKYPRLDKGLAIAKLIRNKELQQKVLLVIWEEGSSNVDPESLIATLEAYSLLSPDLQNPALRIELLESYFAKCKEFNEKGGCPMGADPLCGPVSFKELIQNVFDSVTEEEKRTILFGIAKNINIDGSFNYKTKELLEEIHNRCSKELQKEFAYALLKQTLKPNDYREPLSPYILVLEIFMPVSSVCEDDIDGLIDNVLSKEQPSFTVFKTYDDLFFSDELTVIVDPLYADPFYHDYSYNSKSTFQDMCTAVLNLYMPCEQISLEKKNLMIETMACNQSLSKDYRKKIIAQYIQDPRLAEELLYIVDQDLSDKRFKRTKLAARDEEQS